MNNIVSHFLLRCLIFLCALTWLGCGTAEKGYQKNSKEEPAASSQKEPATKPPMETADINVDASGRALGGNDVVAYHENALATPGDENLIYEWGGAKWYFSNEQNQARFKAEPLKYAPSNGGYCTFGIMINKKLDGNPEVWHIKDQKLFMFLNPEVRKKFLLDEAGNLKKVAENWPLVQGTNS